MPLLDNPFSQRVNAIIQKTREMRRGVYHPHLYIVKEDGEPPLRLWALSALIQDRSDVLPSYQQFITQLKDKVRNHRFLYFHALIYLVFNRSMGLAGTECTEQRCLLCLRSEIMHID